MDIHEEILDLHRKLREEIRAKFNRSVPLADELLGREERARWLGFGEGTTSYDSTIVLGSVKVGAHTWLGPFTILDGSGGGLEIGDYCSISAGVHIYTHNSVKWALSGGKLPYERAPVKIHDCCFIGPQTVIAQGVEIGPHTVVGAHSYVKTSLPPNSICFGVPARVVGVVEVSDARVELRYHPKLHAPPESPRLQ